MFKRVLLLLSVVGLIVAGIGNMHVVHAASQTKYVTASKLNVRTGPSTKYKVITTVKKNQSIKVIQKKGAWSKVKLSKKTGWVSSKYLTTKKPKSTKKKKSTTSKKNIADQLKKVGKNKQLILVTSKHYNSTTADIQTFEKNAKGKWVPVMKVKGHVGKKGFAKNKREGDGKTPVGKYSIGTAFGQKGNPGTKLAFRKITNDDVWVDDSKSKLYNTWQSRKKTKGKWKSAESMNHRLYKYGFVINYNTKRVPKKGSAIFFHVSDHYTMGCIATSEANVKKILKWLNPAKKPVIVQTPIADLQKY
ncbi:SH3 domain-containing protein [Virgibacillus soli]|uniref:SH3 domain-containing protein n=1 Tax=Paracerasibacillus soli TaxID=480284 RepID=A0ABU5CRZ7_9BACI|nr:SH3 domain-containing protein [Virgibacillus soli]MDY0409144.1 SH3 domain-containing protein [Virgibacillus soli]